MKIGLLVCSVIVILFVGHLSHTRTKGQRAYEICQSFKFMSPNYIDTQINVIVNITEYELEGLFDDIRAFHNNMNGEPDELTISLYNSREGYKAGECIGTMTYYKECLNE